MNRDFLITLGLQQVAGLFATGLSIYAAIVSKSISYKILHAAGAALWATIAIKAFIIYGIWMAK